MPVAAFLLAALVALAGARAVGPDAAAAPVEQVASETAPEPTGEGHTTRVRPPAVAAGDPDDGAEHGAGSAERGAPPSPPPEG